MKQKCGEQEKESICDLNISKQIRDESSHDLFAKYVRIKNYLVFGKNSYFGLKKEHHKTNIGHISQKHTRNLSSNVLIIQKRKSSCDFTGCRMGYISTENNRVPCHITFKKKNNNNNFRPTSINSNISRSLKNLYKKNRSNEFFDFFFFYRF